MTLQVQRGAVRHHVELRFNGVCWQADKYNNSHDYIIHKAVGFTPADALQKCLAQWYDITLTPHPASREWRAATSRRVTYTPSWRKSPLAAVLALADSIQRELACN